MSHATRIAVKVIIITTLAILFSLLFIAPTAAQKEAKEWKPAMIPADALKYGADIEAAATPEFLRWAHSFATGEMRHMQVNPKALMEVVDKKFAGTPDDARDAGIFLVEYLGYKDEEETQKMRTAEIRELNRQIYDANREMNIAKENTVNSKNPAASAVTKHNRYLEMEESLKELGRQLEIKMKEVAASRNKVNLYLKVLKITHERMNGIPPAAVAGLK